ncbi:response regulator transcription factor [Clostridium folliculivorans]|uniref:Stage 0 sporulation protein A homolog n=1 Tax=Clostridium folliculivorans TaxID=2886038 RepID=A0A9W5Y4A6_9CLOT|nr:response regulator transcription factor [Clostridium folliculivorans]GKU26270.1 DNA-binding response regulator [Clostridium folliculivorans]GKU31942.1 DNA-binding response regulator [Clostridium folliculivorans]
MSIRLLICDDDALIRESLRIILSMDEEIDVIDVAENGLKALDSCIKNIIDIVLLDIRMPLMNGVDATREIISKTKSKVIILTTFDEDEYIKQALSNGASGYILKNNPPDKIINTIKLVASGNSVMEESVFNKFKENMSYDEEKIDISLFTERELEIIRAISEGMSNKEISAKLFISEGTVKNYITNILNKTGLNHRTQIAIYYIKGKV